MIYYKKEDFNVNLPWLGKFHLKINGDVLKLSRRGWRDIKTRLICGYKTLCIKKSCKVKSHKIHRLLLMVYVGKPPNPKSVCRHLDGNKLNNSLENLCWGTHQENSDDKLKHGTMPMAEKHQMAKLTNSDVVEIFLSEKTIKSLAIEYSVSMQTIQGIRRSDTWASITDDLIAPKRVRDNKTSKYLGVIKTFDKWRAGITVNGKFIRTKCFNLELEAAMAYDQLARFHFGEKAELNFE